MQIFPHYRNHFFPRTGIYSPPVLVAHVEDEMGDDMSKPNRPTIDATMTAFLRTPSGAKKSASTITVYRTQADEKLWVVTK